MAKLTEVKNTKFTYDDSEWIEGIIKKVNASKSDREHKISFSQIMREATLRDVKKLEKEIEKDK